MMNTVNPVAVTRTSDEPLKLSKRIGSTTYKVTIRFSENATETLENKLLRLIEREVSKIA